MVLIFFLFFFDKENNLGKKNQNLKIWISCYQKNNQKTEKKLIGTTIIFKHETLERCQNQIYRGHKRPNEKNQKTVK